MNEESQKLLVKASRSIHAAEILLADSDIDFAAGRAYYAMFYTAKSLLIDKGLRRFNKHTAVLSAFGEYFSKPGLLDKKFHKWLIDAFDKRTQGDYEVESPITSEDVGILIEQAREFLEQVRRYLTHKQ